MVTDAALRTLRHTGEKRTGPRSHERCGVQWSGGLRRDGADHDRAGAEHRALVGEDAHLTEELTTCSGCRVRRELAR